MARSSDSNFLLALFRDKTFQAREIRRVIGLSFLYLAITTVLVGIFYHQILGNLLQGMAPLLFVSEDMQLASEAIPALGAVLGKWLIAMLAVNVVITVCLALFISRRLGQPILAIKRTLREIGSGNLDVRLRTSDSRDFGEIASELTTAMRTVREQVALAKEGIEHVDTLQSDASGEHQLALEGLRNCRTALDYFQVDNAAAAANQAGDEDTSNAA